MREPSQGEWRDLLSHLRRAKNQGTHSHISVPGKPTFPLLPVSRKPCLLGQEPGVLRPQLEPLIWLIWGEETGAQRKAQGSVPPWHLPLSLPIFSSSPRRFLKQKEAPKCPICIFHSVPTLCWTHRSYQIGMIPIVSIVIHIYQQL